MDQTIATLVLALPGMAALVINIFNSLSNYREKKAVADLAANRQKRELNNKDAADEFTRNESFLNRLERELKECREGREAATATTERLAAAHRNEIDALREEHKQNDRATWKEMGRIQARNLRLEADARDMKQKVTVNALAIGSVAAKADEALETVKKVTDLHMDQGPGEPADPSIVHPPEDRYP